MKIRVLDIFASKSGPWWIIMSLFFACSLLLTNIVWRSDESLQNEIQSNFLELEKKAELASKEILVEALQGNGYSGNNDTTILLHVYERDSLKHWSSNKVPVPRFASLKFPAEGLVHLKNGWYYTCVSKHQDVITTASFLVKQKYRYQNEYLKNYVSSAISPSFFLLTLDEEEGFAVLNHNKEYAFSVSNPILMEKGKKNYALVAFTLSLSFLFLGLLKIKNRALKITAVGLFFVFLYGLSISGSISSDLVSPRLFAYNFWVPNILSVLVLFFALGFLLTKATSSEFYQRKAPPFVKIIVLLFSWWLIENTVPFVLNNSSIPISLDNLFELEIFSYIILVAFVLLFLIYNALFKNTYSYLSEGDGTSQIVMLFVLSVFFLLLDSFVFGETSLSLALPLALTILNSAFMNKNTFKQSLLKSVFSTTILSVALVSQVTVNEGKKELDKRKVLAKKVIKERDRELEIKYLNLTDKLTAVPFLSNIARGRQENLTPSKFSHVLENKFFNGFWEGYECSFNFFGANKERLVQKENMSFHDWQVLIDGFGEKSEICTSVYFIPSSKNGFNYVIKQEIPSIKNEGVATLFIGLKSKLIPEEIGFPRLLISDKANTLDYLKRYSIAKYKEGKLSKSFGSYSYPIYLNAYSTGVESHAIYEGQSHYILRGVHKNAVVLSTKKPQGLALFTPYAYIFCVMGIIRLLFLLFSRKTSPAEKQTASLAFKIQAILVSMVVLSLFLFGAGSGLFVKNQYTNYNKRVINEKLQSVSEELKNKIAKMEHFDIEKDGVFLEKTLNKLSRVFLTDINIYDVDGFLVSSSRQQVFNMGLLSEQINAAAFESLINREKTHFSQEENIGGLGYTSSYMPVYNKERKTLGYINLQHFGQQEDYESQIQGFLVAIINVFMFLLALSIILSLVISNWLTLPLQVLQDSLSKLKLGERNKKIVYAANDEIGTIVQLYNDKIEELETAADQLTRNERESAWRDMAKQVAHEIKNPLTPMKLSVQHLLRSYDEKDPKGSQIKIKRVVEGIIEQIDGLARIANEFSNFARMPEPNKKETDLVSLIKNTLVVYQGNEKYSILFTSELEEAKVLVDKNQLVQVLNNLIKNAIQSFYDISEGAIKIKLVKNTDAKSVKVSITDNGVGIDEEHLKSVFIPRFTTKTTGSGIGLSLVKQTVENHGGEVSFSSKLGEGSVFTFTVPTEV
ncbi:ATP-binding protein [Crocinitomicaceae bacterium]|nr:ATP-binding protein [Crocinitomicaceae bacterium]